MKLNPEKCIFGVPRDMLLGFVVSERGIEANPDKISVIMHMGPIKNLKGVQRVTGCLATLSRFIAQLGERSLPLYQLMKKSDHFTWTPEEKGALDSLKNMLKSPPILIASTTEESMLLYIPATTHWPARRWWSSGKSPGGPKRCNNQCTSSARYSPTPRCATHKC
jgi:hypothetical protein